MCWAGGFPVGEDVGVTDQWWLDLSVRERDDLLARVLSADPELDARLRAQHRASAGDVAGLREVVDATLRTRRFLDWREARVYAEAAWPVVELLSRAADTSPGQPLVELVQRALSHVLKVLHRADDNGLIGEVFAGLLDVHVRACQRASADPVRLAKWLTASTYDSDWFNPPDPVPYATELGVKGVQIYREAAERAIAAADLEDRYATGRFHGRYARRRLAVIDRDPDAVVASFADIERAGYREAEIAAAMREIGRDDLALEHARAGLAGASNHDRHRLAPIADVILTEQGDTEGLLVLRRDGHHAHPNRSTYAALRDVSQALGRWDTERPAAIVILGRANPSELVAVLLAEGRVDEAWDAFRTLDSTRLHEKDVLALIEARSVEQPGDAMGAYLDLADTHLANTGREHYERAVRLLKKAAAPAARADREADLRTHVAALRETHKRRPTLITLLDRAALDRPGT